VLKFDILGKSIYMLKTNVICPHNVDNANID